MKYLMYKFICMLINIFCLSEDSFHLDKVDNVYFIYKKDDGRMLREHGLYLSCSQILTIYNIISVPILTFDSMFFNLEEDSRKFIIYHELAHTELHSEYINDAMLLREKYIEMEHEADIYAVNKTSAFIALKTLDRIRMNLMSLNINTKDITDRINYISLISE